MLVNILLSTYNGEKYILEQLESINSQTYSNIHLYIRDDGSKDNTVQIIKNFTSKFPITVLKEKNIGFMKSFFLLLEGSTQGDYWAFCDQDDVWLPHKIEAAVNWLKLQDQTIPLLYHSSYEIVDENLSHISNFLPPRYNIDFRRSITENCFSGFSCVINGPARKLLLTGNPEKIDYHDWWLTMIIKAFGLSYFDSVISAKYRRSQNSLTRISFTKKILWFIRNFTQTSAIKLRCLEFSDVFYNSLSESDKRTITLFTNRQYRFGLSLKKAFFPKPWRPDIFSEISMRLLMLFGKV